MSQRRALSIRLPRAEGPRPGTMFFLCAQPRVPRRDQRGRASSVNVCLAYG